MVFKIAPGNDVIRSKHIKYITIKGCVDNNIIYSIVYIKHQDANLKINLLVAWQVSNHLSSILF